MDRVPAKGSEAVLRLKIVRLLKILKPVRLLTLEMLLKLLS